MFWSCTFSKQTLFTPPTTSRPVRTVRPKCEFQSTVGTPTQDNSLKQEYQVLALIAVCFLWNQILYRTGRESTLEPNSLSHWKRKQRLIPATNFEPTNRPQQILLLWKTDRTLPARRRRAMQFPGLTTNATGPQMHENCLHREIESKRLIECAYEGSPQSPVRRPISPVPFDTLTSNFGNEDFGLLPSSVPCCRSFRSLPADLLTSFQPPL